ncbi:MAG: hypothetical protein ABSB32_23445, partial [Thermodesulfobacteriota bacterium]
LGLASGCKFKLEQIVHFGLTKYTAAGEKGFVIEGTCMSDKKPDSGERLEPGTGNFQKGRERCKPERIDFRVRSAWRWS